MEKINKMIIIDSRADKENSSGKKKKKPIKLQLALDDIILGEAIEILYTLADKVDIIEVGTPMIMKNGMIAVQEIRKCFPDHEILADMKIMDAGFLEAQLAFEAGADIVTVLGAACNDTIVAAKDAALKYNGKIMIDMIAVEELAMRATSLDSLQTDYLCVHTAFDRQQTGQNPLEELIVLKGIVKNAGIAVAGGINSNSLDRILRQEPDIVVVGGGIMEHPDRRKSAENMKEMMRREQHHGEG